MSATNKLITTWVALSLWYFVKANKFTYQPNAPHTVDACLDLHLQLAANKFISVHFFLTRLQSQVLPQAAPCVLTCPVELISREVNVPGNSSPHLMAFVFGNFSQTKSRAISFSSRSSEAKKLGSQFKVPHSHRNLAGCA